MAQRLRVLNVVPSYLPATRYGGPIYSVHGLCRALVESGHEVHVFTTNVDGNGDTDVPLGEAVDLDGVKVWYFPSRRLRRLYWSPEMKRELGRRVAEFDLVHLHSVFLWPTWAAARVARRMGVPYVLAPRGMLVRELVQRKNRLLKSAWISAIEKRNLRFAAAIHVTSELEKEDLGRLGLDLSRIEVVANGVDVPKETSVVDLSEDIRRILKLAPYGLYVGRLSWKKGLDRLLVAWSRIEVGHLVIAGNDEEGMGPWLERLIDDLGLNERVTLLVRHVSREEQSELFAHAGVSVLTSYSENFGNVVLEAMAAGCPVVVTDKVGAADIVRESGAGVVSASEPDAIAESIRSLLDNPSAGRQKGDAGRTYVVRHLTWEGVASRMETAYQRILVNNANRTGNARIA